MFSYPTPAHPKLAVRKHCITLNRKFECVESFVVDTDRSPGKGVLVLHAVALHSRAVGRGDDQPHHQVNVSGRRISAVSALYSSPRFCLACLRERERLHYDSAVLRVRVYFSVVFGLQFEA